MTTFNNSKLPVYNCARSANSPSPIQLNNFLNYLWYIKSHHPLTSQTIIHKSCPVKNTLPMQFHLIFRCAMVRTHESDGALESLHKDMEQTNNLDWLWAYNIHYTTNWEYNVKEQEGQIRHKIIKLAWDNWKQQRRQKRKQRKSTTQGAITRVRGTVPNFLLRDWHLLDTIQPIEENTTKRTREQRRQPWAQQKSTRLRELTEIGAW